MGALERGLIQKKSPRVRAEREKAAARRKDALTGTSDYPDLHEKRPAVLNVAPLAPPKEASASPLRAVAVDPSRRAVRKTARGLRPRARQNRRAAESVPRQSRQARPTSPRAQCSPKISTRPAASRR